MTISELLMSAVNLLKAHPSCFGRGIIGQIVLPFILTSV